MLSTGLSALDRKLRGGVPPGTLLAFLAPPDTQAELLIEQFARSNTTRYVTTVRDRSVVDERLPDAAVVGTTPGELLSSPEAALDVPEGGCLVVDAVTGMERDLDGYRAFLETAAERARERNGVVLLYGHEGVDPPARWLTLAQADMTWRLSLVVNPLAVETRLVVTKNREGTALTEPLKLRMTDHVAVDTSRDIG